MSESEYQESYHFITSHPEAVARQMTDLIVSKRELEARVKQLEGLASSYLAAAAQAGGCGDGGCVVLRPTGMHTNGGCRCTYDMDRTRERGVARLLGMAQHMARAALNPSQEPA